MDAIQQEIAHYCLYECDMTPEVIKSFINQLTKHVDFREEFIKRVLQKEEVLEPITIHNWDYEKLMQTKLFRPVGAYSYLMTLVDSKDCALMYLNLLT